VSGASNVLKKLSRRFQLALVSNFSYSPFIYRVLKQMGIDPFFDYILISDSFGWRKPHPKIFTHLLDISKFRADETIFIGDDVEADIKGSKKVGIKAVLLARASYSQDRDSQTTEIPDFVVNSLPELAELLLASTN
jgi:putative hydrolase of the HAD superfamily